MKKYILGTMAVAALFTACDPATDSNSWNGMTMSQDVLQQGITLKQYDADADGNLVEAADGNWIEFTTNPSTIVDVYYLNADGGEMSLSKGKANGLVNLAPSRGSDPNQTMYFRTHEYDGSSVVASKVVTVKVATELAKEMAIICSNSGKKTWKWDLSRAQQWGNMGYTPGPGEDFADNGSGIWWGVATPEELSGQQQHAKDYVAGDAESGAYMVFEETGIVKCYDTAGNETRKGSFEIQGYDPENGYVVNDQRWKIGTLHTSEGATLFPYKINGGGTYVTDYEIIRLSADQLILTYADAGTGSWSEATFWFFTSNTDNEGIVAGYDKEGSNWTWDTEAPDGAFWGNAGYHGGDNFSTETAGKWWGVTSTAEFAGQQQHRGGDKITGDDDTEAWMNFTPDGQIASFDAAGNQIRGGSWSFGQATVNGQDRTVLNTTAGSILWPYAINTGGEMPEQFEVMYLTGKQMTLIYAAEGTGDWSECTFWRFKKK